MRLSTLSISNELGSSVGLANSMIRRLGSLVALIGKNGSGKTRVLSLIESSITEENFFNGFIQLLPTSYYRYLGNTTDIAAMQSVPDGERIETFNNLNELIQSIKAKVIRIEPEKLLSMEIIDTDNVVDFSRLISSQAVLGGSYDNVELTKSAIKYLNSLSSKLLFDAFNAFRRQQNVDDLPNQQIFGRLKNIVKQMMGVDLDFDDATDPESENIRGMIIADGKPFNYKWLSPGQKILFSYCVYFFILDMNPGFRLKDSLIIIDEPERHLHPEAQIQLIDGVRKIIEERGQLWIATHSVHILSHLRPEEIFFVENATVRSPSSMTPTTALRALMGYHYNEEQLAELLLSASDWAFSKYIADCLENPLVVVSTDKNDPQFKQFVDFLHDKDLKWLLDYGAGHGRLEKTLAQVMRKSIFKIDVFEPNRRFNDELKSIEIIETVYNDAKNFPSNHYDLVVLSNVLHELHVRDWGDVFKSIKNCLSRNGYLMILEDLILPKGEAPNDIGYLVLGIEELAILFSLYHPPLAISPSDEKYRDRIMCVIIKQTDINVSKYNAISAIEKLKVKCLKKIKDFRENRDEKKGRLLAFYTQQFLNCELALQYLNDYSNKVTF